MLPHYDAHCTCPRSTSILAHTHTQAHALPIARNTALQIQALAVPLEVASLAELKRLQALDAQRQALAATLQTLNTRAANLD
jgi:hypothetical protein